MPPDAPRSLPSSCPSAARGSRPIGGLPGRVQPGSAFFDQLALPGERVIGGNAGGSSLGKVALLEGKDESTQSPAAVGIAVGGDIGCRVIGHAPGWRVRRVRRTGHHGGGALSGAPMTGPATSRQLLVPPQPRRAVRSAHARACVTAAVRRATRLRPGRRPSGPRPAPPPPRWPPRRAQRREGQSADGWPCKPPTVAVSWGRPRTDRLPNRGARTSIRRSGPVFRCPTRVFRTYV